MMQNKTFVGAIAPVFNVPNVQTLVKSSLPVITQPAPFNPYASKSAPTPGVNPIVLPGGNTVLAPGRDPNAFYSAVPDQPTEPAKPGINFSSPLFLGGAALLAYFLFKK